MTNKHLGLGLVAVLIIAIVGWYLPADKGITERVIERVSDNLGAVVGPDIFGPIRVHGPLEEGGCITTMSQLASTYTITANDMRDCNVLTFTASSTQAALTATLPASSTIPISYELGASRSWIIENPFTAAATTTTIAAGAGVDLQEPDGQNVVIGINNFAWLTCFRQGSTIATSEVICRVDETIPAD